jgi:hypothetical protein
VEIKKHLGLLGLKVKDVVTGMEGIVDSVYFDLYGVIQASIMPPMDKKGDLKDSRWFDVTRIKIQNPKPIMEQPNFEHSEIKKYFDWLGFRARDHVTRLSGIIDTISFDLYGCVQIVLRPQSSDNKLESGTWLDVSRVGIDTEDIHGKEPVMQPPNFEHGDVAKGFKGPADKPCPSYSKAP